MKETETHGKTEWELNRSVYVAEGGDRGLCLWRACQGVDVHIMYKTMGTGGTGEGPEILGLALTESTRRGEWWKVLSAQTSVCSTPRGTLHAILKSLDHKTSKWQSQDVKSLGLLTSSLCPLQ